MISPLAAPPIVVIFERHWDNKPKQIVKDLLPPLLEEGYDTLCMEAPQDREEGALLSNHNDTLKENTSLQNEVQMCLKLQGIRNDNLCDIDFQELVDLITQKVPLIKKNGLTPRQVAEKIKMLPSSKLLKEAFVCAKKMALSIEGVDIDARDHDAMLKPDVYSRIEGIDKIEAYRMGTISENLCRKYRKGKGLIFLCGALHAENLMNKFKEQNLHDKVLYYFPREDKRYLKTDTEKYLVNETLKDHTFHLLKEDDYTMLLSKIISDIKSKNCLYKEEILHEVTHISFLKNVFQIDFKAFMRPGFHLDALLDIDKTDRTEEVIRRLQQVNVQTYKISLLGINYLVIPNVNTRAVAENIRQLTKEAGSA